MWPCHTIVDPVSIIVTEADGLGSMRALIVGPKVVYGADCLPGAERLRLERITFRQTPYEVKTA